MPARMPAIGTDASPAAVDVTVELDRKGEDRAAERPFAAPPRWMCGCMAAARGFAMGGLAVLRSGPGRRARRIVVAAALVAVAAGGLAPQAGASSTADPAEPRTAPVGVALPGVAARGLSPDVATPRMSAAARVTPAGTSCVSSGNITTLLTSGSLAATDGFVFTGLDQTYMIIGNTTADILSCGGIPRLGERFYVRATTSDVQGGGEAALFTQALRLPPGLYPAIDANNPVFCFARNFNTGVVDSSVTCPNALILDAFAGGAWNKAYPWYTSTTYSAGQSQVPAGWTFFGLIPVVATRTFAGLGSTQSDFLWGGVRVGYVGTPGTTYGYSYNPITVLDRVPESSYPAAPVTAITNTTASLNGIVANFWKGGTAVAEFGATTAYGRVTAGDAIPGNDPTFAAYQTSPLAATALVPGTTYHWRLKFTTTTGLSYYGADQTFTTTGTKPPGTNVPGAPTGVRAVTGNRLAAVSWVAPASTGGLAISGYVATATPGGRTCTAVATARACTITGLVNGAAYRFSVRARNGLGLGAASALTAAVVPSTIPTVVRSVVATYPAARNTRVTWLAPVSNGGSAIRRYEVRYRRSTTTVFSAWRSTALVRSATFTTFLKGATYYVQVRAVNVRGGSAAVQVVARPTK